MKMEKSELISIATYAIMKDMDREELKYSDELYGKENQIDSVWQYVKECKQIGEIAFREKYSEFKMYI